jgi:hypothetical protein|tara:strand:+ start:87 stop:1676 length:1590 start_codon:yes stop_codon:yes gene_type:complete
MANAENTGPSLRDMAFAAAGGKRKSSNALVDAANKVFASYADQMADEALKRKADPNYRDRLRAIRLSKAADRLEQQAKETKMDTERRLKRKQKLFDKSEEKKLKSDDISSTLPPLPGDTPSQEAVPESDPNFVGPSANKMRSPIKQRLYDAAFAAAGGYRQDTKKTSKFIDDLAKAAIETRRTTQKILRDKVTKELENFSPEVVDLEGFNGFMNGKNAVTNFGIDLKQKIAEKRDAALKLNPYSMKYKETMAEINSLVESTKNLNLEQTRLKNLKKEWGTVSTGGDDENLPETSLYSKGSSKKTINYINQVMSRDIAPMMLDENGKVQFEVLKVNNNGDPMLDVNGGALTEIISFDDLNKNLFLKVDKQQEIDTYQRILRSNINNNKPFSKENNKAFWGAIIAPAKDGTDDDELLSWIHDMPYNTFSNKSFYEDFKDAFLDKELAITADGESLKMTQEALDILFDPDTRDWDAKTQDGKTVREYIREELINYYARTAQKYYYLTAGKQDPDALENDSTIGTAINEVKLP